MYIFRYFVTRTNLYIVIHTLKKIHTTRVYNTPVQYANQKIKRKRKTDFYWSDKMRQIYPDRVMIQFIFTHITNKAKGKGSIKTDQVTIRKISDAPVTYTRWLSVKYRTGITGYVAYNVTNTNNINEMQIYPRFPRYADNIHKMWIIFTKRGDPQISDNAHKIQIISTTRTK